VSNPNPQHNPTDGLGVAAYVQVTGTNITNCSGGGLTPATESTANDSRGLNGQGYGAVAGVRATPPGTSYPNAQYTLQLSLGSKTYGGVAYFSTCQLTTVLKDVANVTYSPAGSPTYKSYNDPDAGSPSWFRPSVFAGYSDGSVASVSSSGLITALAVGQAIIEVQFPTFDFAGSALDPEPSQASGDPVMMIYCQIIVNVVS
jgi:hypothetical protein